MKSVAPFEIGLVAGDIDALLPFYTDVLGLALLSDMAVPAAKSRATGLAPEGYRVVRLQTNRGDRLKLARGNGPLDEPGTAAYPMQRRGAAYLTFIVDDVQSVYDKLRRAGVPVRSEGVVPLRPGLWLVLATDPEGNWLEFLQYDDLASYRPEDLQA
jgi:catechol 2,3-dioxygenase-like lactoylglutathione lyase family enzyme